MTRPPGTQEKDGPPDQGSVPATAGEGAAPDGGPAGTQGPFTSSPARVRSQMRTGGSGLCASPPTRARPRRSTTSRSAFSLA